MEPYTRDPRWTRVGDEGILVRPLRAQTAQGPRVALARSIALPAGSHMTFELDVQGVVSKALLTDWLDHGRNHGFGQWRTGGFGAFTYELS